MLYIKTKQMNTFISDILKYYKRNDFNWFLSDFELQNEEKKYNDQSNHVKLCSNELKDVIEEFPIINGGVITTIKNSSNYYYNYIPLQNIYHEKANELDERIVFQIRVYDNSMCYIIFKSLKDEVKVKFILNKLGYKCKILKFNETIFPQRRIEYLVTHNDENYCNRSFQINDELIFKTTGYIEDTTWKVIDYLVEDKQNKLEVYKDLIDIQDNDEIPLTDIRSILLKYSSISHFEIKSFNPYNDLGNTIFEHGICDTDSYQVAMRTLGLEEGFLFATQDINKTNLKRVRYYLEKIYNDEYICGICAYIGNSRAAILDGHHRVLASYIAKQRIDMICLFSSSTTKRPKVSSSIKNYINNNTPSHFNKSLYDVAFDIDDDFYSPSEFFNHTRSHEELTRKCIDLIKEDRIDADFSRNKIFLYLSNFYSFEIFELFLMYSVDREIFNNMTINNYIDNIQNIEFNLKTYFGKLLEIIDIESYYMEYKNNSVLDETDILAKYLKIWFIDYETKRKKFLIEKEKIDLYLQS